MIATTPRPETPENQPSTRRPIASQIRLLTADEFQNDLAPETIVQDLIYRASTHLLTGASKGGKSWVAYQLALSVQDGVPFLGLETVSSRVLVVSLEMNAGMVRKRMEALHEGLGLSMPSIPDRFNIAAPTLDYLQHLDVGAEEGRLALKELIAESKAELVILDTLYKFLPGLDPNSNAEMGPVFAGLNDIAQSTGAAIVMLDHVAKGEHVGSVSQSALGAQVKGGASRVIIALKRVSRDGGGRWQVDVESHFGNWDVPIFYERPLLEDESRGSGCVMCSASRASNLSFQALENVFLSHGDRDEDGRRFFASQRKLIEALKASGLCSGNNDGSDLIRAIRADWCVPDGEDDDPAKPIVTRIGNRNAIIFLWKRPLDA